MTVTFFLDRAARRAALPGAIFVSADTALCAAARAEGLEARNPLDHAGPNDVLAAH